MPEEKENSQEEQQKKFYCKDFRWECPGCHFLLGFISNNCETVRMKYRDFYVEVEGGNVTCSCRRCAKLVKLTQQEEQDPENSNKKSRILEYARTS